MSDLTGGLNWFQKLIFRLVVLFLESKKKLTEVTHPDVIEDVPKPEPVQPPTPEPHNGDDLDLKTVNPFTNESESGKLASKLIEAKVVTKIVSASISGEKMNYAFLNYPSSWSTRQGKKEDGTLGPVTNAIVYFFYLENGVPRGGKYDFMRLGGQTVKDLENVVNGYSGLKLPPIGRDSWTMISNFEGTERSNTRKVDWK